MPIKISHQFDSGAIDVLRADEPENIELLIRRDRKADFLQWFHFRLQGARHMPCQIRFLNASQTSYPDGWVDYQAVASYDREQWFRVPTTYDGRSLRITYTPERDSIFFAYFEPYSYERHLCLLGRTSAAASMRIKDLGSSIEGRDISMIEAGDPAATRKVWIIARQHPGEAMASWFIEGMVDALLDRANPVARSLLASAKLYIVPMVNPDGAVAGNLRTNAAGVDLNRAWMAPSMATSPEVFLIRERMHQTGCDLFIDVHGDEGLPYVFVAGNEMLANFNSETAARQDRFSSAFRYASPDFQTQYGYDAGKYNDEILRLASKYVGHTFGCLSLTLEMPFKDNAALPDPKVGWNGARSAKLGAAILQPLLQAVLP